MRNRLCWEGKANNFRRDDWNPNSGRSTNRAQVFCLLTADITPDCSKTLDGNNPSFIKWGEEEDRFVFETFISRLQGCGAANSHVWFIHEREWSRFTIFEEIWVVSSMMLGCCRLPGCCYKVIVFLILLSALLHYVLLWITCSQKFSEYLWICLNH